MDIVDAVINCKREALEELIKQGADLSVKHKGSTLVSLAIKNENYIILGILLANGAPYGNVVNGHAVIYNIAIFKGCLQPIEWLLDYNVPYNLETLLKEVSKNCDYETLQYIIQFHTKEKPLVNILPEIVKRNKARELQMLFKDYYTSFDVFDIPEGVVLTAVESGAIDCIPILLEKNISFGSDAIEKCAELGDEISLMQLLKLKQANHDLDTALRTAVEYGHQSICDLLLDAGADINTRNYGGQSLVFIAKEHNQKAMLQYLLSKGVEDDTDELAKLSEEERNINLKMTQALAELIQVDPTILQKHLIYPLKKPVEFTPQVHLNEQHNQILKICDGFHLFDEHNQIGFFLWGSEDFSYQWYPELTDDCLQEGICPFAGSIPHNVSVRLSDGAVVATDWEDYSDKEYFGRKIENDVFTYIRTIIELWEKYDATAEDGDYEHSSWWSSYANYGDREDLEGDG